MKKPRLVMIPCLIAFAVVISTSMIIAEATEKTGEQLFAEHCSTCHPQGSNVVNPKKTLMKKDRDANNVKTAEDIIKIMRKPGPGMMVFDKKTVSDADARKIADYVVKKFNK